MCGHTFGRRKSRRAATVGIRGPRRVPIRLYRRPLFSVSCITFCSTLVPIRLRVARPAGGRLEGAGRASPIRRGPAKASPQKAGMNYIDLDHASMFDDGRDSVKGELPWTLLDAGNLRLEARNQNRLRVSKSDACSKALRVSSFLRHELLALAQNAIGLLWVWIGPHGGAAVGPVRRTRVPANAHWIVNHAGLRTESTRARDMCT